MKIQISSFNVHERSLGSVKPHELADWLLPSPRLSDLPDLLVVGTQETQPLAEALSGWNASDKLRGTASTVHRALTKYAGVGDSKDNNSDVIYTCIHQSSFAGLIMLVYARPHIASQQTHTHSTHVGLGVGGVMGNKGAISTRIHLPSGGILTLVNAHLAAHQGEENVARRNWDYRSLVSRIKPSIYDSTHLLVFGDLNYRLYGDSSSSSNSKLEQKIIDLDSLASHDELAREMRGGRVMNGLREGCFSAFLPTYKYTVGSVDGVDARRDPSWTDRVLFASAAATRCVFYDSFPQVTISDHKPITAMVCVDGECSHVMEMDSRNHNHINAYDRHAHFKALLGTTADLLIGYAWLALYLVGWRSSTRGALLALSLGLAVAHACSLLTSRLLESIQRSLSVEPLDGLSGFSNALAKVGSLTCDDEQGTCVDKDPILERSEFNTLWNIVKGGRRSSENGFEKISVVSRAAALNGGEWVGLNAEIEWRNGVLLYATVAQLPNLRLARWADLVHALLPSDDHGALDAKTLEGIDEYTRQAALSDTNHHARRPGWIHERTEEVEYGGETHFAAERGYLEAKRNANLLEERRAGRREGWIEREQLRDRRRSAEPDAEEAERAPCLVTVAPAPAATTAAAVETLNVSRPSPPVPTISHVGILSKPGIWTEWARITVAAAAIYSAFSSLPVNLSAVRNAAICAGVWASVDTMCSNEVAISSSVKLIESVASFFNNGLNDSGVGEAMTVVDNDE
ncbi:hypothetical protein E3P98_00522 [Wallemia ichthyophaga]|nr:hypothetical protein E3P98_00522 [Wallemia ichthyophaga]